MAVGQKWCLNFVGIITYYSYYMALAGYFNSEFFI